MKRVLIISPTKDEQSRIEEVARFHNAAQFSVETTGSFGQEPTYWTSQPPDVLVIALPDDDFLQGYFFTKLRKDVPKTQAILCLCSVISAPMMQLSLQYSKVRMLKTPVEGYTLFRAVTDLMQEFKESQRQVHPRYLTNQKIEIRSDFQSNSIPGEMKNLSMSGAYFECAEPSWELNLGDFVKIHVLLGSPPKQYTFDIKIVWRKDLEAGGKGFGVTFVNKEAVYNHLLKNI